MRLSRLQVAIGFGILASIFAITAVPAAEAFAQTTTVTQSAAPVDSTSTIVSLGDLLNPWLQTILGIMGTVVTIVSAWGLAIFSKKTGIQIDQAHQQTLQTALTNAAGLLVSKGVSAAEGVTFDVRSPEIKQALNYLNSAAPDAIAHFGLSANDLIEKLLAKIGIVAPTMTVDPAVTAATSTPAPAKA